MASAGQPEELLSKATPRRDERPMDAMLMQCITSLMSLEHGLSRFQSSYTPINDIPNLTENIKTVSEHAVAAGGLADIYFGECWRASAQSEEKEIIPVAIKLVHGLMFQENERVKKTLFREVYTWNLLDHPNIVKLLGLSYNMFGLPAMVMPWYENGNATEYLALKNPNADRLKLILDVARGLEYLHGKAIIHADLKANNVLITDEGAAVLADFGLSHISRGSDNPATLTMSREAAAPVRWQAPELLEGDIPHTLASDVWSFGCTALELFTGCLPYSNRKRDVHVMRDMSNGIKPPAPADRPLLEAFNGRLVSVLDACWSFDPLQRPGMTEVCTELEKMAGRYQA